MMDQNNRVRTVASQAEKELNHVLYTDTGLYRNQQFQKANVVTLETTTDELFQLWNEEVKYRTGFAADHHVATIPVLYARILGVEDEDDTEYWQNIAGMRGSNTIMVGTNWRNTMPPTSLYQNLAFSALKQSKIDRELIQKDKNYHFSMLKQDVQNRIFDMMQYMINEKIIDGTFKRGTEYKIVSTILTLDARFIQLIQRFDLTKVNPKLVVLELEAAKTTIEDTIMYTFLHLMGFDIVFFAPTGYDTEWYGYTVMKPVEHDVGTYMFDLHVPDFQALQPGRGGWIKNILKRGEEIVRKFR